MSGRSQSCQSAARSPRSETFGAAAFCLVLLWFLTPVFFPPSSAPLQANQPAARPEPAGLCRLLLGGRLAGSHQDGPLPRQLHGGGLRFPGVGGQDVHRVSRRQTRTAASKTAIRAMLGFNVEVSSLAFQQKVFFHIPAFGRSDYLSLYSSDSVGLLSAVHCKRDGKPPET